MSYDCFADYYDRLMEDVDYPARAEYLLGLFEKFDRRPTLLLDAACGTGSFSLEFAKRGIEVIGADPAAAMLAVAKERALEAGQDILFLCQSAAELELYGTVDGAVCCMDSLNHIVDYEEFCRSLTRIALFLEPGRLFLFDMNTPYKHREILGDNAFVYEQEDLFLVWQNETEDDCTHIYLDFFTPQADGRYVRACEDFSERAYTAGEIAAALDKAGLILEAVYDDMTLSPPAADSQRLVYVTRRRG
ncbi:MAG TPA: class I SAM-dependent methyltransferase [Firmicutes bacterium]|nr:class I SAM-dependent methyltransferase [Bacillota bacterium]